MHRGQQIPVGQSQPVEGFVQGIGNGGGQRLTPLVGADPFEQTAYAGQTQLGPAVLGTQPDEHDSGRLPQVVVVVHAGASGSVPQPARGEEPGVPLPGIGRRIRVEQHVAVLGDEPEQQPVHQPQYGPLVVLA